MDYITPSAGISATNRERLARLHRRLVAPFTVQEAAEALEMPRERARKFLAYLVAHGWLARVRRNLYVTVPLEASAPADWREDPWIVAARTFEPCYMGGWSASEHWGLTDQLFRDIVVFTTRPVRGRHPVIQGTAFRIKVISPRYMFGAETVWRRQVKVQVSDPSRTVVDLLDDPGVGGGIRHVADVVAAYFSHEMRQDDTLIEYARRLGNRTVFKRLGYVVELLRVGAPDLVRACLEERSSGYSLLDPAMPREGPIVRRWNLRLNAHIAQPRTER